MPSQLLRLVVSLIFLGAFAVAFSCSWVINHLLQFLNPAAVQGGAGFLQSRGFRSLQAETEIHSNKIFTLQRKHSLSLLDHCLCFLNRHRVLEFEVNFDLHALVKTWMFQNRIRTDCLTKGDPMLLRAQYCFVHL